MRCEVTKVSIINCSPVTCPMKLQQLREKRGHNGHSTGCMNSQSRSFRPQLFSASLHPSSLFKPRFPPPHPLSPRHPIPRPSLSLSLSLSLSHQSMAAAAAVAALKEQLNGLINSMFAEGLLDEQFTQLQMLQDSSCPGFVAEVIGLFCDDAERILKELTALMEQPVVDYEKVDAHVHQMKGSSASVGVRNMSFACFQFRQLSEQNNKENLPISLNAIKNQFYLIRSKFDTMLQLEQGIKAFEGKSQ